MGRATARAVATRAKSKRSIARWVGYSTSLRPGALRRPRVVAVVADHGESFGEHGESEHGYLLHTPTLAVPLVLAGAGVAPAQARAEAVGIRRLPATLARLAGVNAAKLGGPALELADPRTTPAVAVYHETEFPASTFGWSPLAAVTVGTWRFVSGPKPALFDLAADPGELTNRLREAPERARALQKELGRLAQRARLAPPAAAPLDDELRRQLESLGYLSGASARRGSIDPAEGVLWLPDFADAKTPVGKRRSCRGEAAPAPARRSQPRERALPRSVGAGRRGAWRHGRGARRARRRRRR